jgi:hypothetical protein
VELLNQHQQLDRLNQPNQLEVAELASSEAQVVFQHLVLPVFLEVGQHLPKHPLQL